MYRPGKAAYGYPYRGFESLPFRQNSKTDLRGPFCISPQKIPNLPPTPQQFSSNICTTLDGIFFSIISVLQMKKASLTNFIVAEALWDLISY